MNTAKMTEAGSSAKSISQCSLHLGSCNGGVWMFGYKAVTAWSLVSSAGFGCLFFVLVHG